MPPIDHALIHRARVVGQRPGTPGTPGTRNVLGEVAAEPYTGPWFPARLMTKRQSVETADDGGSTRRRKVTGYSLIWGTVHSDGTAIIAPDAQDEVEVDRGRGDAITHWQITGAPLAFDTGAETFGGQAELVVVGDST